MWLFVRWIFYFEGILGLWLGHVYQLKYLFIRHSHNVSDTVLASWFKCVWLQKTKSLNDSVLNDEDISLSHKTRSPNIGNAKIGAAVQPCQQEHRIFPSPSSATFSESAIFPSWFQDGFHSSKNYNHMCFCPSKIHILKPKPQCDSIRR